MHVCVLCKLICMYVFMSAYMHVCMYLCMRVCMYVEPIHMDALDLTKCRFVIISLSPTLSLKRRA